MRQCLHNKVMSETSVLKMLGANHISGIQFIDKRDSKVTENGVVVCMSHKGRCPWDSNDLKKGASETGIT